MMSLGHHSQPHRHPRMNSAAAILVEMARDSGKPVMAEFDLFLLAKQLFRDRGYRDQSLPPRNRELSARRARKLLGEATRDPALSFPEARPTDRLPRDTEFASAIFVAGEGDAAAVMMAADPFCYLSHASALAHHGLSHQEGPDLQVSTPERGMWAAWARALMSAALDFDIADADEDDLPFPLIRPRPGASIRGRALHRHETGFPVTPVSDGAVRTAPVGATFRDTLDAPAWCGGIAAVISIWRHHARDHLEAIIAAIDESREKIVRVRAGYLLEEVLGIADPRIETWLADAQRGSSRKLDSASPYASRFSARWMLSINLPDPDLPATTR